MSASADLFTPQEELDRQQALREFIAQFKLQLKSAKSTTERRELKMAIKSYYAALQPPVPTRRR